MIQISEKVKLEENGKNYLVSVPENSKEKININLENDADVKIIIEKNSEVKIVGFSKGNRNIEIDVKEDSKVDLIDFSLEGSKSFVRTNLGERSEANNLSVVFGDSDNEFEIESKVIHKGSNSKSDMVVRAVMIEKSRIIQTGLVRVDKNAVGCEGYQKSDVILLSGDAYAEAIPNLEIENNDVKCSHGATISQVDEDKLFYMKTRGLDEATAKRSIVEGFFDPVILKIGDEKLEKEIKEIVMKRIDKMSGLNVERVRKDFPILNEKVNGKQLVYLDSGATSLTPKFVVDGITEYYNKYNANVHRGIHKLSERATIEYEKAHGKVAKFINGKFEEVIFTKNITESMNLLAYSLIKNLKEGDEIVVTETEHHSNIVPWQQLGKEKGIVIKYIRIDNEGRLDLEDAKNKITEKTKIVSMTHMSNVLGTINPVKEIREIAKNSLLIIDAAQSVPHLPVDVKELGCDFLAFSGHKMLGPTGIGVLWGKEELLEKMDPFLYGGDMISKVGFEDTKFNELPWKFEAGTPAIAQGIGLGKAVDYLSSVGMKNIKEYEEVLTSYALEKLKEIDDVEIYGPLEARDRGGVISFNIKEVHSHDVSAILDREGIAVRGGHLCAMPLVTEILGHASVCRASLYFYNTKEEIDKLVRGIKKVKEIFKI